MTDQTLQGSMYSLEKSVFILRQYCSWGEKKGTLVFIVQTTGTLVMKTWMTGIEVE